jgi:hypothetical protein
VCDPHDGPGVGRQRRGARGRNRLRHPAYRTPEAETARRAGVVHTLASHRVHLPAAGLDSMDSYSQPLEP